MFRTIIKNTPFTTQAANSACGSIYGDSFREDVSFVSTLRALVCPRIDDSDSIFLRFTSSQYRSGDVEEADPMVAVRAICPSDINPASEGVITIHSCQNRSSDNDATTSIKCVDENFEEMYPGWRKLNKVTEFYRKTFSVVCFINPETKSVILFVENMDVRKLHYLQCSIFAFLPWYFDPKEGVSELEMELINSLREKTPDKYMECLTKLAEQYNFREKNIQTALKGFETKFEEQKAEEVRASLENNIREINRLNNEIGDYFRKREELETTLLGLEAKIAQGSEDSEIMNYFLCNKHLYLEQVTDSRIIFSCAGYLEYFDEDLAKDVIDNPRSFIYYPEGRDYTDVIYEEDIRKLMYAIFVDQTLRIRFCSAYVFNLAGRVSGLEHHEYGCEFSTYTPNPHIDQYACLGNHLRLINECLTNRDYIAALEQCVSSCGSLNFGDSTVMSEFMKRIYRSGVGSGVNMRCIELPDGTIVEPMDAIEWLKEKEDEPNE